jgi:hypothetical protein
MRLKSLLFVTVIVFAISINVFAFDGQRKGFILGGGIGFGMTSHTEKYKYDGTSQEFDSESKGALMTNFKIGFAPSEQVEIYYTQLSSLFKTSEAYVREVTILNAIGGIGVTYSLNPSAPTVLFNGGLGLAMWALPFEDNPPEVWSGLGLWGGVGYEFSRHYSAQLDLAYGNPKKSQSTWYASEEWSTSALSVRLTINALAY